MPLVRRTCHDDVSGEGREHIVSQEQRRGYVEHYHHLWLHSIGQVVDKVIVPKILRDRPFLENPNRKKRRKKRNP